MLWLVTMVGYIGFVGYHTAMSQTDFWITKDGYAIIYETNNHFYLAEYNQEERKPDKQHQIIINKESVEFFYNVD